MPTWLKVLLVAVALVLIGTFIFFGCTPTGKSIWVEYTNSMKKVDEDMYENKKIVEDTARAMIASYEADVLTYNQYKDSDNEEKQGWAEQAKMRANQTASSYNNYILKNSYVWEDNIPEDIKQKLPYVE